MRIGQVIGGIPQHVRIAAARNDFRSELMSIEDINTYVAAGMLFQTAIPDLSIGFSQRQAFDCEQGMSLFGIRLSDISGKAFIVQTTGGKFRDFDYETHGHILESIVNWGRDEKEQKTTIKFPLQATGGCEK